MEDPVIIDDERVLSMEIVECGEPLVDAQHNGFPVATDHRGATSPAESRFWCRETVLSMMRTAASALPSGIELVLAEGHRPLALQRAYWQADLQTVRATRPNLNTEQAEFETAKYVAPPWTVPPHTTGGAVDMLLFENGVEMPMGCELNEQCAEMRTGFENLGQTETENRQLLVEVMSKAGFINYGHEWWHYSYGDRYWAFSVGADVAIYGGL